MLRARTWWASLGTLARVGFVVLGVVFVLAIALFLFKWAPELLATHGLKGKDKAEDIGRNRTSVLASLAFVIAVVGATYTGLSYRLNRAGQITERFTQLSTSSVMRA